MDKCVVFDFDGVIIDSHEVQKKALRESFQSVYGEKEPPYDDFFDNCGDSLANIFDKLGIPQEALEKYIRISRENIDMIKIHKGMELLIKKLNNMGVICALCTGKDRERTEEILRRLRLYNFFRIIVCSDDIKRPKPYPDSLMRIADEMNIIPEDIVMVGDGINDILCAQNTGSKVIAVTWGDTSEDKLSAMQPNAIVSTDKELDKCICEMLGFKT